jgi:very-short-patch-repair endonuclease
MPFLLNDPTQKDLRRKLRKNQTEAEKILWGKLKNRQMHEMKFFRQYGIGRYVVDFCCPAKKLVVELDGGGHAETSVEQYDQARSIFLRENAFHVLRFWNTDIFQNIDGVLAEIEKHVYTPGTN